MPAAFKNRAAGTDARTMRDTVVTEPLPNVPDTALLLDGEAPRLAAAPTMAPPPVNPPPVPDPAALELPAGAPVLPLSSPVLAPNGSHVPPPDVDDASDDGDATEPRHPMAHLMPEKSRPSEASLRAAEARAAKKAKARKIKIGLAAGFLVVAALVGPPLAKWLTHAVNTAGGTPPAEETSD